MNILEFLSYLHQLDVQLQAHGDRLRITAPAGVLTRALQNQLRERKADLLIHLRQNRGLEMPPRLPRDKEGQLDVQIPISLSQQTSLFIALRQSLPTLGGKHQRAWLLTGHLDIARLEDALRQMIERHEILRTTFFEQDGQLYQQINKPLSQPLVVIYLPTGDEGEIYVALDKAVLSDEALWRLFVLRLDEERAIFWLTLDEKVADDSSVVIFMRELMQCYQGELLAPLPFQYADFAHWQRETLTNEILNNSLGYWQEQLANLSSLLKLPHDHREQSRGEGGSIPFQISPELTQKLKRLSEGAGATLMMTFLAALNALLFRYGQKDESRQEQEILLGVNVTRRLSTKLIGNFSNMLILRSKIRETHSFSDLLRQVRQHALDAYAHQEIPFYKIVEAIPSLPFPQITIEWASNNPPEAVGLGLQPFELDHQKISIKSELALKITPEAPNATKVATPEAPNATKVVTPEAPNATKVATAGLNGYIEYDKAYFERETIERLISHLTNLLKSAVANPQQAISRLPLLSSNEQNQILVEWNQTELPYDRQATIHHLFEATVEKYPEQKAISDGTKSLTYQELNQRANQLAHNLQKRGIGPNILVGICMMPSLEMGVALLAVLKAGGAYLILDPSHPMERLSFIIEHAQLSFLLMQEAFLEIIPRGLLQSTSGKRYLAPLVICIDRDWAEIAPEKKSQPITKVSAHHLAYVNYISHSSGQPKGILMEHQALVSRATAMANLYNLKREDRFLAFAPLSMDSVVQEFFALWLIGATVMIGVSESKLLTERIIKEDVSVLYLPATEWHEWKQELIRSKEAKASLGLLTAPPTSLRLIIVCDGEVSQEIAKWSAINERLSCLSVYDYTAVRTAFVPSEPERQLIGRPLGNTKTYILDKHLQQVPIGVFGWLYVAGDGLPRGYLRDTNLTNEHFILNPFEAGRMYKTGHLARYLRDGNIERLTPHRCIKLRGFNVDLGEVEARLLEHPIVREGRVIARPTATGGYELVAYFSPNEGSLPSQKQWQTFLSQKLPQIMIPTLVLPEVGLDALRLGGYSSPVTPTQHKLVELWNELLQTEVEFSIHDHFFAIGGNEILANQFLSRLYESFQIEFSLRHFLEAPTIAELAEQIETMQWATQTTALDLLMDNREEFDLA